MASTITVTKVHNFNVKESPKSQKALCNPIQTLRSECLGGQSLEDTSCVAGIGVSTLWQADTVGLSFTDQVCVSGAPCLKRAPTIFIGNIK